MNSPVKSPVNDRALENMEKEFWRLYDKAIEQAKALTKDRQESYIGEGRCILEGAICGEMSMLYEINKKNIRLKGLLKTEAKHGEITSESTDSVEDTLLDLINYSAFHLVYREMVRNKSCEIDIQRLIEQEGLLESSNHHKFIRSAKAPVKPAE